MATATKTDRRHIEYRPGVSEWFASTQDLFNCVVAFYFDVIQARPNVLELSNRRALTALERLTHTTERNPNPEMPLKQIAGHITSDFRRAAINAAVGSARSFFSNLERWRKQKEKTEAKGRRFTSRPPVPPRTWNRSVILYSRMRKERANGRITLKLWDGRTWRWVRFKLSGRDVPQGREAGSPQVVRKGRSWWLHTPLTRTFPNPGKVKNQIKNNPNLRVCAVDLNINDALAVCTIQTADGTAVATRFIRGGRELHGRRKSLLGRIARNRRRTGIIAKGEQDNADLWAKIRHLDENAAHRVSRRIVQFARQHGARVIVFEHLGNFKPRRGKYSRRSNEKRTYWLRGRIFRYAKYKAWEAGGIITSRVSPRNTSRLCARCDHAVARYGAGETPTEYRPGAPLFLCLNCGRRGNADHNSTLNIGRRFFARYHQEKPPTRSLSESPKGEGVLFPQVVETWAGCTPASSGFLPIGTGNGAGAAPPVLSEEVQFATQDGIPRSLRPHRGSGYAAHTSERRLCRGAQRSPRL